LQVSFSLCLRLTERMVVSLNQSDEFHCFAVGAQRDVVKVLSILYSEILLVKHMVERSKGSGPVGVAKNKSTHMEEKDKAELKKLLEGLTPEEILEVKRLIEKNH